MACGARSGLKQPIGISLLTHGLRLNGLWSPFGIETIGYRIEAERKRAG